jgi:ribosomal protein S12 methylthiotransferase
MNLQSGISLELNQKKIGKQYKVIIDRREGNDCFGRTEFDSPEVDNEVIIRNSKRILQTGTFVKVEITSATEYDLEARLVID